MNDNFVDKLSIILANKKLIDFNDVQAIHRSFREREDITFQDFLLEEGLVDKDDLLEALSEYYQMPAVDVRGEILDHHNIRLIPKDVMIEHFFIPLNRVEDTLTVVAANPTDPHVRYVLGQHVDHHIEFNVGLPQAIIDTVREFYDKPITYQPGDLDNQLMERSQQEVHPMGEEIKPEKDENERVPHVWEETIDDYES